MFACCAYVHYVMSSKSDVRSMCVHNDGYRSSFIEPRSRHVSMSTRCDNAGMFVVMPHHIDMIRFIKRWICEGRSVYYDTFGKAQIYPGKRYFRAIDRAILRSQLVVFTGETYTPSSNITFDGLIAIILMGEHDIPVRPLVFVASAWKDKICWDEVLSTASTIRSSAIHVNGGDMALLPHVVEVQPNIDGHHTLSATEGPGVFVLGESWSFRDTLEMTLKK